MICLLLYKMRSCTRIKDLLSFAVLIVQKAIMSDTSQHFLLQYDVPAECLWVLNHEISVITGILMFIRSITN